MYAKIQITGNIETVTGMHIGGSSAFAAIGAVDSPVIKDVKTNLPMIPGSSLKGKMRTLLAKMYNDTEVSVPDNDCELILRLFGSSKKDHVKPSRLIVSDMFMNNKEQLYNQGIQSFTEVKFENTINRLTAVANPRQIERTVRGSCFGIVEDISTLVQGIKLLQYDYLGGNGSRGYGKVRFSDLEAEVVVGDISDEILDKCNEILKEV